MIEPQFQKLSSQYGDKLSFYRVDVDQQEDVAVESRIVTMPTYVFFEKGKETKRINGANPPALQKAIKGQYARS